MAVGAQPWLPPRGGGTPASLRCLAMRVIPQPSADRSKNRSTTGAWAGFITRRAGGRWVPLPVPGVPARTLSKPSKHSIL